jgi:L-alanine-DL-glutamate epimerase-like enolase superfamily enzyme
MKIVDFEIHRCRIPLDRPIGDSQVIFTEHFMTVLELKTDDGQTGVGFELQQGMPIPALSQLEAQYRYNGWSSVEGQSPLGMAMRIGRPRGGNVGATALGLATETAMWDLAAKQAELPLYRLFGGTNPRVRAYGSTLDFHLDETEFRSWMGHFTEMGMRGIKIKVGHPDIEWDLSRLSMVHDVLGEDVDVMIDANEAWSPKEAIERMKRYDDAGFEIFWIEDPITREDYPGYAMLAAEIGTARINTGEYLGFHGKRRLLESGGVDVLNIHGQFQASRAAAYLAGDYGVPVSLGNTLLELGVHLAASLPECLYLEFSDLAWNRLAADPVKFEDGHAIAPDRPGHGVTLDRDALAEYSEPE